MIEFVSLLLGLVVGLQPVELSVVGAVAEVEMQLDGQTALCRPVSGGSPVRLDVDFGPELRPHELVAIARDARGRELDRARRWINLEADEGAAASLVFSGGEHGLPRQVGVAWEGFGRRLEAVEMAFDGQPLAVVDPAGMTLPAYDHKTMHFLTATVRFDGGEVVRLEAAFGGGPGTEIETELTAVAVTIDRGVKLPPPGAMGSWFQKHGQSVAVHGVENLEAEVVVVRDPSARGVLSEMTALISSRRAARLQHSVNLLAPDQVARQARIRLVSPVAVPLPSTRVAAGMFARSPRLDAGDNGFLWLAGEHPPPAFPPALASAVALAGLQAHASQRPRAVVLLLGEGDDGRSQFSPAQARRFLDHLQVPLFVLAFGVDEPDPAWGPVVELDPGARNVFAQVGRAFDPIRDALKAQRIVWLKGHHLPDSIELAPEVAGIRLVGKS